MGFLTSTGTEKHVVEDHQAEEVPRTEAEIAERDAARGFTDADLAEVMDNPKWTEEQLRQAKPFGDVFPEMAAAIRRARTSGKS